MAKSPNRQPDGLNFSLRIDATTGQPYLATPIKGKALLVDPFTNKGMTFSKAERRELDLDGLLPPSVATMEQQLQRNYANFLIKRTNLERFSFLASLQDRNETLFYRLCHERIEEMVPVVYTPVVGEACQRFSHIYRRPRGLYVSYHQRDDIERVLRNIQPSDPSVIVVTDGERILGLGDQGVGGMAIPIGKLCLYTLCAGIPPWTTLPITLDVGTDNEELLADPLYVGLRQRRIRGEAYQEFIDRFVDAVIRTFPNALLQWEDFFKGNAISQLARFRHRLPTFNDDIQGTAAVAVAGIYGALRITAGRMRDQRIVFAGAGASAHGIAQLCVLAMIEDGLNEAEARRQIWTVDSRGLVLSDRSELEPFKAAFAHDPRDTTGWTVDPASRITLEDTIDNVRPTVLIGVSAMPGTFSESVVRTMAQHVERPIIFPLSNPTSRSECTAAEAVEWSDGRAIVATGSPFDPVTYGGMLRRIGQCNNVFIFPGVGLGVYVSRATHVSDGMFLAAARALADSVTDADLAECAVYPQLRGIRSVSRAVALAVIERAVAEGHAPEAMLANPGEAIDAAMWFPEYLPIRYESRRASDSAPVT